MTTLYTIAPSIWPEDKLTRKHFEGAPELPHVGVLDVAAHQAIGLPVYHADPSAFMPDHLVALPVDDCTPRREKQRCVRARNSDRVDADDDPC